MPSVAELILLIQGKDEASGVLNKVKGEAGGLGTSAEESSMSLGQMALKAGEVTAAVGAIAAAVRLFVEPAAAAQVAQAQLQAAVEATGASFAQYKTALEETANRAIGLGFADEAATEALALLTTETGSAVEAQKRLALAMDVSRGTHLDLYTASKLVGKVTDENVNVLARYGVVIAKGTSETEALAIIQQKFGGQSAAYAETAAGQWAVLTETIGQLKEKIGTALLPLITSGLRVGIEVVTALAQAFEFVSGVVHDMAAPVIYLIDKIGGLNGILEGMVPGLAIAEKLASILFRNRDSATAAADAAEGFGVAEGNAAGQTDALNTLLEKQVKDLNLSATGFEASVPGIEAHLQAIQAVKDAYGDLPPAMIDFLTGGSTAPISLSPGSFSPSTFSLPSPAPTNIDTQVQQGGVVINGSVTVNQAPGQDLGSLLRMP